MSDYINYSIPTGADYWTRENEDVPQKFLDRVGAEVAAYIKERWRGVDVTIRFVPETESFDNRSRTSLDDEYVFEEIDNWMSFLWSDWLEES